MQSDIIGDIYDAILDPSLWEGVLERTARFVGGVGASLFSKDASSNTGAVAYSYGIDPHYSRLYFEKYVKLDPATTGHLLAEIEEPIATGDFISYEEFLETRFYREWARPQGLVDFVSCVLDKSATAAAMFGVFRHEEDGVVDEQARERMRVVSPHYRRAVLIGRLIDLRQSEAATFADILDGLSAGLFLVDAAAASFTPTPPAAPSLPRTISSTRRGPPLAHDASVDRTLRAAVVAAAAGDPAACIGSIAVPSIAEDREHYVLNVLPLDFRSGAPRRHRRHGRRGPLRAQGGRGYSVPAGKRCAPLQADADRASGTPCRRRASAAVPRWPRRSVSRRAR